VKRLALVIAVALLGLASIWVGLTRPQAHPGPATLSAPAAASGVASGGTAEPPTASTKPGAGARRHASAHRSRRPASAPTTTASAPSGQSASTSVTRSAGSTAPVRKTSSPAPYAFAPAAHSTGPASTGELRLSDLALHAGQTVTADVPMTSPGALVFDAHTATSSSTSGSYPLGALRACVQYAGQSPCIPVATPLPAYWSVTSADLAHHHDYRIRVLATVNSSLLAGMHFGWRGPKTVTVSGVVLPGGCQATVGKGYVAGCGLKYKLVTTAAGPLTVTTPTSGLETSLKNTTSNAKVYSGPLTSPQRIQGAVHR